MSTQDRTRSQTKTKPATHLVNVEHEVFEKAAEQARLDRRSTQAEIHVLLEEALAARQAADR